VDDTLSDAMKRAAERARALDPQDVAAVDRGPRPHRQLASLESPAGRPYDSPSFMDDGDRILVTRIEGTDDGAVLPDLFEWRWRQNFLRRITHGAAIRHPDAAPSGDWAAATQCLHGFCSIVRVALRDGKISVLAQGTVNRTFYRPRISRDGSRVVASLQEEGRWRLVVIDVNSGAMTVIDPDDGASRFDADFTPDGREIVTVSGAGGIFNLEVVDPVNRNARRLTNIAGAALAPAITTRGDTAYFLSLRSNGYHLRRIALNTIAATPDLADSTLALAIANPTVAAALPQQSPIGASSAYGLGPQRLAWIPYGGGDAGGYYGGGVLSLTDPVGVLGTTLVATAGAARSWRGAELQTAWRGWPVEIGVRLQSTRKQFIFSESPLSNDDVVREGAELFARKNFLYPGRFLSLAAGGWMGRVERSAGDNRARTMGFASFSATAVQQNGPLSLHEGLTANFEAGRTAGGNWNRSTGAFDIVIESPGPDIIAGVRGGIAHVNAAPREQFIIGGDISPHLDRNTSGNFVAAPILREAILSGDDFVQAHAELSGFFPFTLFGEWNWPGGAPNNYFATGGFSVNTDVFRIPQVALPSVSGRFGLGTVLVGAQPRRAVFFAMLKVSP
jgi:hypothetical protein